MAAIANKNCTPPHSPSSTMTISGSNRMSEQSMSSVSIEEAQANLPQLIEGLTPGEEVVITKNG